MSIGKRDNNSILGRGSEVCDAEGKYNMKKILIAILVLTVLGAGFVVSLAWYAGLKWKRDGKIPMRKNNHMIELIEENVFTNIFSCLSFSSGLVYHGQDTFELVKFIVNVDDPSWNVLSNRIYTSRGYISFEVEAFKNAPVDMPVPLEDLACIEEVLVGRLDMEEKSLYMTYGKDTKKLFVYLEGNLVPTSKLGMVLK